jgi:hippurate hydrolase
MPARRLQVTELAEKLPDDIDARRQHAVELRRWLHRHPELSFNEAETAARIVAELDGLGIPCSYPGPGGGVIGRIETDPALPTVALRAEMDALPGHDLTDSAYRSVYADRMHACGHDAHMTMVLGAAAALADNPPHGNVVLIFQPAEERGGGSRVMIEGGALEGVRAIFGGHVTHEWPTGKIMIRKGAMTAQSDRFQIAIKGKGGHGARPHEAIDAVVIAALLITTLQTLVSRQTNPVHPSVITVGKVTAGTAPNVIAESAKLEGTIRTTFPESRDHIHKGIRRMVEAMGELHDAAIHLELQQGYPPVINTPDEVGLVRKCVRELYGPDALTTSPHASMGSEDFSFYLQHVPGAFFRFGARRLEWEPMPLHSPRFDIDEAVLAIGAEFFDAIARRALRHYAAVEP